VKIKSMTSLVCMSAFQLNPTIKAHAEIDILKENWRKR